MVPRCACPLGGRNGRLQTGPHELILQSALYIGVKLANKVMKLIIVDLGLDPLKKGSGTRGGIKNVDLATYLIDSVFPDASVQDKNRMIAAILGKKTLGCTHDILKAVSLLDPEESQCFEKIRKSALDELEAEVIEENRNSVRQRAAQEHEPQEPSPGEDRKPKIPSEPAHEPPDAPEAPECPTDGPPAAPAPEFDAIDAEMDTLLEAELEVPPPIPRKKKEIGPGKLGGDVSCESVAFPAPAKTSITIHRLPAYGWQGVLPKGMKCNVKY